MGSCCHGPSALVKPRGYKGVPGEGEEKAPGRPCSSFSVLELIEKLESSRQIAIGHGGWFKSKKRGDLDQMFKGNSVLRGRWDPGTGCPRSWGCHIPGNPFQPKPFHDPVIKRGSATPRGCLGGSQKRAAPESTSAARGIVLSPWFCCTSCGAAQGTWQGPSWSPLTSSPPSAVSGSPWISIFHEFCTTKYTIHTSTNCSCSQTVFFLNTNTNLREFSPERLKTKPLPACLNWDPTELPIVLLQKGDGENGSPWVREEIETRAWCLGGMDPAGAGQGGLCHGSSSARGYLAARTEPSTRRWELVQRDVAGTGTRLLFSEQ